MVRDAFGDYRLPGSSLAGAARAFAADHGFEGLFGRGDADACASSIEFSDGFLLDWDGRPVLEKRLQGERPSIGDMLEVQEHVRIDHQSGAAEDSGKFDAEVVSSGLRFRIELTFHEPWADSAGNAGKFALAFAEVASAIAEGKIFTLGDAPSTAEDKDEYLLCFSDGGKPLWKTKTGKAWSSGQENWQSSRSTPTVDGGMVYVVTPHGDVVCCSTTDGNELWRKNLKSDFGGNKADGWGYSESVLIDEDRVVCTPGGPTATMVALNKNTGEVIWKCSRQADRGAGHASIVMARIGDTRVYLQTTGSGAMAVRAQDGKLLWTNTFDATIAVAPNPIVHGDLVFFSAGYGRGGALIQQVQQNDEIRATAVYGWRRELANKHGGVILMENCLFGDSDDRGLPFCADLKTGKLLWRSRGSGQGSVAMAGADGCLYLRFSDGTMTLAKAASSGYRETGSFRIPGSGELPSWSHPAIADARLFLREQDSILCYDLQRPDALADSSSD